MALTDPLTGRTHGISDQRDKHIQFTHLQDAGLESARTAAAGCRRLVAGCSIASTR
ncbi:MAG: hypothetical protein H6924_06090 [Alphaproteobacteria bacterium]|nr:hypothetical protein [Alphaproteobacteria bacterium]